MPPDLDIRLLRHFVAVAEELHFSRAAHRLYVTQQALSRDVRRLEDRIGVPLLERTSRHVALTAAGERLLHRAQRLLALHDETLRAVRGENAPLLVNIVAQGHTPAVVLNAARRLDPATEFFGRFHGGLRAAVELLTTRRLDAAFGRWDGTAAAAATGLDHRVIRYEPLALLVPAGSPLAADDEVPLANLRGAGVCWLAGDHVTPEWEDAARQLLGACGAGTDVDHPHVRGIDELAHHVRSRDSPVLTLAGQPAVPGAVVRPLTAPGAVYPWSIVSRAGDRAHQGLRALFDAARDLAEVHGWLDLPPGTWLPEPEASQLTTRSTTGTRQSWS